MFVPLDVPIISPLNMDKFIKFYFEHAKESYRIKADISGDLNLKKRSSFLTLNSYYFDNRTNIWSRHYEPLLEVEFKEIFEQVVEYLPISPKMDYTLWSSTTQIIMHRDNGSNLDMPINFRIKLFDNNPTETLLIKNCFPTEGYQYQKTCSPIPLPSATNSFAWNNLRVVHGSKHDKNYFKILMVITNPVINWNKYVTLLDKSIEKFKNNLLIDNRHSFFDYIKQ